MEKALSKDTTDDEVGYILIDPPVTPFSPTNEILNWIQELKAHKYNSRPEVQEALETAKKYLKWKKEND